MAAARIRHLQVVDGYLRYRRRVPDDLRGVIGQTEWVHVLGLAAGQEHHAARVVAEYDAAYARVIAHERVRLLSPVTLGATEPAALAPVIATAAAPNSPPAPKTPLSEAYDYDRNAYGGSRYEKGFKVAVDSVLGHVGDIDIRTLTPKAVQEWVNACAVSGQKPSTIARRVTALRAIVNRYFRDHDIERRNPFSSLQIKNAGGGQSDRLPFHRSHLQLIDRYFERAPRLTDDIRHVMRLLKLTGARPLEIGGLDVSDVILDHDVPHLWIRNNAHRRIKTKGSERRIPLIGEALEAANAARAAQKGGALFAAGCHDTNSLSQRLNKLIRRAGVPKSSRLVVYSFRHTVEEALRSAGVPDHSQRRIMGHTDGSMTGRYGAPAGMLEELRSAMRLAAPLLGKVDLSIYDDGERVDNR